MAKLHAGIYLGFRLESGEGAAGTPDGAYKVRSIKPMQIETKWSPGHAHSLRGTPWMPYPFTDKGVLQALLHTPPPHVKPVQSEFATEGIIIPRTFQIAKEELVKVGRTPRCEGYLAAKHGTRNKPHTAACRERLGRALLKDEDQLYRVLYANARLDTTAYENDGDDTSPKGHK